MIELRIHKITAPCTKCQQTHGLLFALADLFSGKQDSISGCFECQNCGHLNDFSLTCSPGRGLEMYFAPTVADDCQWTARFVRDGTDTDDTLTNGYIGPVASITFKSEG